MEATTKTKPNPLIGLAEYGQSQWLDYIRRNLITSGELQRLIDEDGLKGVTSNAAIFEKALSAGDDYKDFIRENAATAKNALALYERIAVRDIQEAADILKSVYDRTNKRDGYISLEVSPALADDTEKTIEEARRLWQIVNRPNLMVKVPATEAGVPAIEQLISEGININVTLLFAQDAYAKVAEAYVSGLEKRAAETGDLSAVTSVASFFVSRIDSLIDLQIEEKLKDANGAEKRRLKICAGALPLRTRKWLIKFTKKCFRANAGNHWRQKERRRSEFCGLRRERKTPVTAMFYTSKNSSAKTL